MKNKIPPNNYMAKLGLMALCLSLFAGSTRAETLLNFPFNEGSGLLVNDTAQNLVGSFGLNGVVPEVDTVALTNDSPSGLSGDGSLVNNRSGFLLNDDTAGWLNITNGPITIEGWIKINSNVRQPNEGIVGYGSSYKLGLRNRVLTFTLFGIKDIASTYTNVFPVDEWVHVAAAWNPGVGVDFYVTSATLTTNTFTAYTATAARPIVNSYLAIASEGLNNPLVGEFDRMRIHNKVLAAGEIDNDAANPKAPLAETLVAYNFDESAMPSTNTVSGAPSLPLIAGNFYLAPFYAPVWTNDTPTGLPDDFALAFNLDVPTNKQRINLEYQVDLGSNNTNYTLEAWVKLPEPLPTTRMILFRTSGAGPRASLSINSADRKLWTTIYGNTDFKSSVVFPDDNAWHHVAVVMENFAQMKFYLDGVLSQTMNRTASGNASGAAVTNLLIGLEGDTTYFKGLLDRVRISNSALSADQLDSAAIPAPKLSMQFNGTSIVLTWPASFAGYTLESAETVDATTWAVESASVVGDQYTADISLTTATRFYRLRK